MGASRGNSKMSSKDSLQDFQHFPRNKTRKKKRCVVQFLCVFFYSVRNHDKNKIVKIILKK